jgi:hypothetical protein
MLLMFCGIADKFLTHLLWGDAGLLKKKTAVSRTLHRRGVPMWIGQRYFLEFRTAKISQ